MPVRLPLFPLNVVLFPGTPLPLHIFEPRYRAMLTDCLADDGRFGIAPTGRTEEAPPPGAVGCRARIRVNQPAADGRSNIVVVGESRFVLVRYLEEPHAYYVGMVETFEDDPDASVPEDRIDRLRAAFATYVEAMRTLNDAGPDEFTWSDDPGAFSFQVSATVELDHRLKQTLLEMRAPADRVEVLLQHLPRLASEATAAARVHQRAKRNGKGGTPPDPVSLA